MYATEKYVKMEAKELRESINQLAIDLGGDVRYLDERIAELHSLLLLLQQQIESRNREENNE
jgi:hypothetical protein